MSDSLINSQHKLSVVIMTYNEEDNIGRCIDSVETIADEVIVVDSYSTDTTVKIAEEKGAHIITHAFEGYIEQRQFCVEQAKHELILALDADEWLSDALSEEILQIKQSAASGCWELNRLNRVGDEWVRHGTWYPQYILRLFTQGTVRCAGKTPHDKILPIDEHQPTRLKSNLLHQVNEDYADRVTTINRHSTLAAQYMFQEGQQTNLLRILFKPPFRFINEYLLRGGFKDGKLGFFLSMTASYYVFLREIKLYEKQRK